MLKMHLLCRKLLGRYLTGRSLNMSLQKKELMKWFVSDQFCIKMTSAHWSSPLGSPLGLHRVLSLLSTPLFSSLHSRTPLFPSSLLPSSLPCFLSTKLSPSYHPPTSTDSQSCCIATSSETYWRCRTICLFSLPPLFQWKIDFLEKKTHIAEMLVCICISLLSI